MKIETFKCPDCGAPLHFDNDQEFCFCSHCGSQVYKEDIHYDAKIDLEKRRIDKRFELQKAHLDLYKDLNKNFHKELIGMALLVIAAALLCLVVGLIG